MTSKWIPKVNEIVLELPYYSDAKSHQLKVTKVTAKQFKAKDCTCHYEQTFNFYDIGIKVFRTEVEAWERMLSNANREVETAELILRSKNETRDKIADKIKALKEQ